MANETQKLRKTIQQLHPKADVVHMPAGKSGDHIEHMWVIGGSHGGNKDAYYNMKGSRIYHSQVWAPEKRAAKKKPKRRLRKR